MTLRPKDIPCLACQRFRVDVFFPICPPCSTSLPFDEISRTLRDHGQFSIDIPRTPLDSDFVTMANYLMDATEVNVSGDIAASIVVNLTEHQASTNEHFSMMTKTLDALSHLLNLRSYHDLVEYAVRFNIKSPSSTLLNIRKVLPGEAETRH